MHQYIPASSDTDRCAHHCRGHIHSHCNPDAVPFPNALALNQYASFGSGERQGKGTVYRYEVRPTYTWTSPSWNSPREQVATSQPLELQPGYNIETPKPGNTFLFVYVRVANTGIKAVNAPAAQ